MMKRGHERLGILALLCVFVVTFAFVAGCANPENDGMAQTQIVEDIAPIEAHDLIQRNKGNQNFVIIDVRTQEEYADGYIEGAVNLDYYSEDFGEELDRLDKVKTYLIYCRTARRSGVALRMMEELGFGEVYNMSGGIVEWEAEGLPVVN